MIFSGDRFINRLISICVLVSSPYALIFKITHFYQFFNQKDKNVKNDTNNIQSLLCDHICLCCWLTLEHATCIAITTSLCPTQPLTTAEQLTAHRGSPWGHRSHPQRLALQFPVTLSMLRVIPPPPALTVLSHFPALRFSSAWRSSHTKLLPHGTMNLMKAGLLQVQEGGDVPGS